MHTPRYRIVLLNLNHIHHGYHVAPIAFELGSIPGVQAQVWCGTKESAKLVRELRSHYPGADTPIRVVTTGAERLLARMKNKPFPRMSRVLQRHKRELASFDAVVSPDFYSNRLLSTLGERGRRPLFVFSFHGAGDGAYGFDESLGEYDLLLLSGEKIRQRLAESGILARTRSRTVGYPKFDLIPFFERKLPRLFAEERTTVVYNPHFAGNLSSWHHWGEEILDFFVASADYNLIFAPHIMLFRGQRAQRAIPSRFRKAANIHIDLNGRALTDMTYTLSADIYLGDASSQIYEFLYRSRPAVFLNPQGLSPGNANYGHWSTGRVVDRIDELAGALENAPAEHRHRYAGRQASAFAQTFEKDEVSAGKRAAEAIISVLAERTAR